MMIGAKGLALCLAALALFGCSPERRTNGYTLSWYPREGTDYGPTIPGYPSLAMCRHAGVGMSLQRQLERYGAVADFNYSDKDEQPWFECSKACRPYTEGSYLLVCRDIVEFHGRDATIPH